MRFLLLALTVAVVACTAPEAPPTIDPTRIAADVEHLASDELGGRGPGTPDEDKTIAYIEEQFRKAGAVPAGDNGTYFQTVPLVGVEPLPSTKISWSSGDATHPLAWLDEVVALSHTQKPEATLDAEAVFVGHGIVAPEYGWDDYKGADVKGKLVLLFTNEPPSDDPAFFGGKALTYYGRWTFKYEEALRHGAAGVLIVHTDETAGYPWSVVRNSWGRTNPYVKLAEGESALTAAGWITSEAAAPLLDTSPATAGKSIDDLLAMANQKEFTPIPLQARVTGKLDSKLSQMDTRNVVAKVEGSDPAKRDEAVLYTAHWDHLGRGEPDTNGDGIYNGAVDNATGTAIVLELARAFGAMKTKPARTILFAAVTAEEGGLRGSEYFGRHPPIPAGKIAVDLNYDGILPIGRTSDMTLPGYERTTLAPVVEELAAKMGIKLEPEAHPEQGYYYRSDHFSLARVGVPAFSLSEGQTVIGKPANYGEQQAEDYRTKRYHQQSDEYRPEWDFSGLQQLTEFGLELGLRVAALPELPTWKAGDEFLAAREKSWKQ
ncbi:MAG: M28 family peptidase [Bryobacterales bacterium]